MFVVDDIVGEDHVANAINASAVVDNDLNNSARGYFLGIVRLDLISFFLL